MKKMYDATDKPIDATFGFHILSMEIIDKKKPARKLKYIADNNIAYLGWESKKIFVRKERRDYGVSFYYKMHVIPVTFFRGDGKQVYEPLKDINFYGMYVTYYPPKFKLDIK